MALSEGTNHSEPYNNDTLIGEVPASLTRHEGNEKKKRPGMLMIGLYVFACTVIVVTVILLVVRYYKRRNEKRRQQSSYGPDYGYTKARENRRLRALTDEKGVCSCEELKTKSARFTQMTDAQLKQYFKETIGSLRTVDLPRLHANHTVIVTGSRYVALPCTIRSMVNDDLHLNRMEDFKSRTVFLASAPMRRDFELFWAMIIKYKIGVIVWAGPFEVHDEPLFDPYTPAVAGISEFYNNIEVKTLSNGEHNDIATVQLVEVTWRVRRTRQKKVTVIHVFEWFDQVHPAIKPLPEGKLLSEIAALPKYLDDCHKRMKLYGDSNGILFQCSTGLSSAAAMLVIYIGAQMLEKSGEVNIEAICKYVNEHRFGAFTLEPNGYKQLKYIYAVLEIVGRTCGEESDTSAMSRFLLKLKKRPETKTKLQAITC